MVSQLYHYSERHHASHGYQQHNAESRLVNWWQEGYKGMQNMHPTAHSIKVMQYTLTGKMPVKPVYCVYTYITIEI